VQSENIAIMKEIQETFKVQKLEMNVFKEDA